MRLNKILTKNQKKDNALVVPRVIKLLKNCVTHGVQDSLIKRLHFNDLCVLLMSLDIAEMRAAIKDRQRERLRKNNIAEVRDISQGDAVKFLKGG